MFIVQISLLIVTFLSLISQILLLLQTTKEVNPHPHTAPRVFKWSVNFLFLLFFLHHSLNVGACICHIAREGQVESRTKVRGEWIKIPQCHITSRKHGEKEVQSFSHCGSFDHHDLQSHNDYKNLFFILRLQISWGMWYIVWYSIYYELKIPKMVVGKSRKANIQLLSNCRVWWSKEPQWENNCGTFSDCFLLVHPTLIL